MKQLYNKLLKILHVIKSKIIFYPTVFAVLGILFAFLLMYLENLGISRYLLDNLPILVVDNGDTALTILSAIITGLISMMVFSFSMVMLLLSQASSNYSPRLLPGLISDKSHQIILGIYLGTILYCIFTLFSIQPTGDKYQIPGFSVLLGIVFTVACIYAFIYFIHNISENIQISKILDKIFLTAQTNLTALIEEENEGKVPFPETKEWKKYYTEDCGYLQNISIPNLVEICKQKNVQLHVIPVNGVFVLKGFPLFRASKELDKDTVNSIISNFNFSRGELVQDNYVLAFKQITEIILKAMSPGINDPGTALNGIDYLSELFSLRMQKKDRNIIVRDNEAYLRINTVDFDELLYNVMAAIRTYCKHDIILIQKLMLMLQYLKMQPSPGKDLVKCIELEAQTLINDARGAITNKRDLEKVDQLEFIFGLS